MKTSVCVSTYVQYFQIYKVLLVHITQRKILTSMFKQCQKGLKVRFDGVGREWLGQYKKIDSYLQRREQKRNSKFLPW